MDLLIEATRHAELEHFWFCGFRRFARVALDQAAAPASERRLDILDCGCGTGVNFGVLDDYGRPFGFDLNALGLDFARRSGRTRIARASIGAIPFRSNRFDLVTSFDVLYTLPEEVESAAVTEMYRVLKPGGALVLNVAALDLLFGNHSVLAEEVRRYDKRRVRRLLKGAGFDIRRLTYTNFVLFPLVLAVRTFQRAVGLKPKEEAGAEMRVPSALVNRTLSGLLALEAALLRVTNMPIGSSLLCVARKPRPDPP